MSTLVTCRRSLFVDARHVLTRLALWHSGSLSWFPVNQSITLDAKLREGRVEVEDDAAEDIDVAAAAWEGLRSTKREVVAHSTELMQQLEQLKTTLFAKQSMQEQESQRLQQLQQEAKHGEGAAPKTPVKEGKVALQMK